MSYDIKLSKVCDNKIVWDDHIVENDFKTVFLGTPISSSNIVVRVNDFKRPKELVTEFLVREDVSSQVTGSNRIFYATQGPIYSGLNVGNLATRSEQMIVRVKVTDEDTSRQFTGSEDHFFTQGHPLMRSNNYDFSNFVEKSDIQVKLNSVVLTDDKIEDIDAKTGRIQFVTKPVAGDTVTVTYYYQAKIKQFDALQGRITIKEIPEVGQEVKIAYYSSQNNGWFTKTSERALITQAQDVVFYKNKNTNRFFASRENVSNQFTGIQKQFQTKYYPILPLYETFSSTLANTLNNAVTVFLNGERIPVAGITPETGKVTLYQIPNHGDVIEVSYYYQTDLEPDRISVDYFVSSDYCDKCSKYSDLIDYTINKLGQYEKVFDEKKLIQDLEKITITILGSDPVATWYGTSFNAIIGTKAFAEITKTKILNELVTALSKLKSAQIQQEEYQTVTDNEFLDIIQSVNVQQSTSEPDFYTVDVNVVTQSGRLVAVNDISVSTKG